VVPLSFHDFFTGCATIAGALIGLLFVALSVSSEYLSGDKARTDHQVRAAAAFSALVNTMVIALFALLPGTDLGTVAIILAAAGLGTTLALIIALAREGKRISGGDLSMFLVLLVLYGLQLANALRLEQEPHRVTLVVNQGDAVLAGFETDVCVTHSAVGLAEAGYRAVVVEDAVYSPFGAHRPGLQRLRDLGVELVHCKGAYYDWARTLADAVAFEAANPRLATPPGFSL